MKRYIVLFILLFGTNTFAQVIKSVKQKVEAELRFETTKGVLYLTNENLMASSDEISAHKQMVKALYNQFGGVTESLVMMETKSKTILLTTGVKHWLIDINKMKQRHAMLLFDGKNKPIIEYKPENYPKLINKHFYNDIVRKNIAIKTEIEQKEKDRNKNLIDEFLYVDFQPNNRYVDAIYQRKDSRYYDGVLSDPLCIGVVYGEIHEGADKQHVESVFEQHYQKGKLSYYRYFNFSSKSLLEMQYYYNPKHQLLDSITTFSDGKAIQTIYFKYLNDKYVCWDKEKTFAEVILLDKDYKATTMLTYNADYKLVSSKYFYYNALMQLEKTETHIGGKVSEEVYYEYHSPTDKIAKSRTSQDDRGNIGVLTFEKRNDVSEYISWFNSVLQYKFVDIRNDDCSGISIMYDVDNNVVNQYFYFKNPSERKWVFPDR